MKIVKALQENERAFHRGRIIKRLYLWACLTRAKWNAKKKKIQGSIQRHSQVLGIKPGDRLSWRREKDSQKHMMVEFSSSLCRMFLKPTGVCEKSHEDLHSRDRN
jgi:hypothetical protein